MKVLWFTNSPCNYVSTGGTTYNGGGWMTALQEKLLECNEISLGISFCLDGQPGKVCQKNVTYYPVQNHRKSKSDKIKDIFYYRDVTRDKTVWSHYFTNFKSVIEDFHPDVIEVFGSELYTGLSVVVAKELNIPCVLHLQGILTLYDHSFLPIGVSEKSFIFKDGLRESFGLFQYLAYWKRSVYREKVILESLSHVIGRTEWDRSAMEILNGNAKYHYGGEILRSCFYEKGERTLPKRPVLVTTSSGASYKGFDVVLKVARILKEELKLDFEWKVYGNIDARFFEQITGIRYVDVNVTLCGVASAEELRESMLNSTVYMQPSYVENSPNSVAEAQILGLTVVASNVGGTSSMVEDSLTGYLYPVTDPYMCANHICRLFNDNKLNIEIGERGRMVARKRHDPQTIISSLIQTYKDVICNK